MNGWAIFEADSFAGATLEQLRLLPARFLLGLFEIEVWLVVGVFGAGLAGERGFDHRRPATFMTGHSKMRS